MSHIDRSEEDSWDEDIPRSRRRRQRSASRFPLVLIVCLAGGGALLVVAVCGGLAFWLFRSVSREVPAAQASAAAFLDLLQQNRLDEAYAQTAPAFQGSLTREQFKVFMAAMPAFTNHTSRSLTMRQIHLDNRGGRAQFTANLLGPGPPLSCTITLTRQGDQWQVHQLNVP